MNIRLTDIGKKFQREWIFRHVECNLNSGEKWAILGANGSGKSTLLQILSGYLTPSQGLITWQENSEWISVDRIYPKVSLATPYMALYDEFTMRENIRFFTAFKSFIGNISAEEFAQKAGLSRYLDRPLKEYSSGMRQRVKLALAILADTPLLLLDEPSSHLDVRAIDWYVNLVDEYGANRIVVVASNKEEAEIPFCTHRLGITGFKPTDARDEADH